MLKWAWTFSRDLQCFTTVLYAKSESLMLLTVRRHNTHIKDDTGTPGSIINARRHGWTFRKLREQAYKHLVSTELTVSWCGQAQVKTEWCVAVYPSSYFCFLSSYHSADSILLSLLLSLHPRHTHIHTYKQQKPLIWSNKCFLCKCMNNFTSHIAFVGEKCSLRISICVKYVSECSGRKAKCNLPPSSSDFWLSLLLTFISLLLFLSPCLRFVYEHFDR